MISDPDGSVSRECRRKTEESSEENNYRHYYGEDNDASDSVIRSFKDIEFSTQDFDFRALDQPP